MITPEALPPVADMEIPGFNSETDKLIASLVESMAQAFFPERWERSSLPAGDAPSCGAPQGLVQLAGGIHPDEGFDPLQTAAFDPFSPSQYKIESFDPLEQTAKPAVSAFFSSPLQSCAVKSCADALEHLTFSPLCVPEEQHQNRSFDVHAIRADFPILSEKVHGKTLVWFDNAATTQKPRAMTERLTDFYEHENSNVHRAAHSLAARATDAYEGARSKAAAFLGAASAKEIIFVRGTTEGINLVAQSYGQNSLSEGDEIIVSMLEHHANIVPWQMICSKRKARLKVIPVDETGQIILPAFERLLTPKTKLVAVTQISNVLGTQTPVAEMVRLAHRVGAKVLVDGAQAVAHVKADVQAMDCDFYVFSGHKAFGPMGIGVLYGKSELLEAMPPYQGGGSMISNVTFEKSSFKGAPYRFEAGTGSIADAVGLGAAIDYIMKVGYGWIAQHERRLYAYGAEALESIDGLTLIGTAKDKVSILPFSLKGHTPEEVGEALNREGIAVRAGHHCAQPILKFFGLDSAVRVSLALYNTKEEIDQMAAVLRKLRNHKTYTL